MIFTDLAELLVKRWGNFMRTEVLNSLKTKGINELLIMNNKLSSFIKTTTLFVYIAIIITEVLT